jgi:hypothetical protein
MILPEKGESLERRLENARWLLRSTDERLTLVTCWPATSNTHRLILIALPEENPQQTSTPAPTSTPAEATPTPSVESGTPTPEMTIPISGGRGFIVRNAGRFSVNIREQPDMESVIVSSLKAGGEADGLGRTGDNGWIYIHYNDLEGWVSADLVQILLPVDSLPTVAPSASTPTP